MLEVNKTYKAVSGTEYKVIDQITDNTFLAKKVGGCSDDPVFVKYWDTGAIWESGQIKERTNFYGFSEIGPNKRLLVPND